MEDAECGACGPDECPDVTDAADNEAAQAAPADKRKREQAPKAGRNVCWMIGCTCSVGLKGVPAERVEDAMHVMQHDMRLDLAKSGGGVRQLPADASNNKLCGQHHPKLPDRRIIGAKVQVHHGEGFVEASVVGPALAAGSGARGARSVYATARWRVRGDGDDAVDIAMSTEEVWRAADLRKAYMANVANARKDARAPLVKRLDAVNHQLLHARRKLEQREPRPPAFRY